MAGVEAALSCSATGSPATVRAQLGALIGRYRPDELLITGMIHDDAAAAHSLNLTAGVLADLTSRRRAAE